MGVALSVSAAGRPPWVAIMPTESLRRLQVLPTQHLPTVRVTRLDDRNAMRATEPIA
jgi:hypothetical protein